MANTGSVEQSARDGAVIVRLSTIEFRVYSGDVQISVYGAASPAEAGFVGSLNSLGFGKFVSVPQLCGFLAGPNRIAEGTARRSSPASNASYQLSATGTLQGVDGRDYHFTEVYQITADAHDPTNPATFAEHVAMINLRPIG